MELQKRECLKGILKSALWLPFLSPQLAASSLSLKQAECMLRYRSNTQEAMGLIPAVLNQWLAALKSPIVSRQVPHVKSVGEFTGNQHQYPSDC